MQLLVTGGSGSFGSEFIASARHRADRVVCYSRGEHAQDRLAAKLGVNSRGDGSPVRFFIGDVRDYRRLSMAMRGITHVVHAAALKIVPKGEYDPTEFVKTNVLGAVNVAEAAIHAGVKHVVALSTDKACGPVNLYGSTKLTAEKVFIAANAMGAGATRFSVVRYGNVTGSQGSVVPAWKNAALQGQPLQITDPRMTRFWMTLSQARDLVWWALENARGGEVIVPHLPAYDLPTLADAVWEMATHEQKARTIVTGLREGEKFHESMISADEAPWTYANGAGHYMISAEAPSRDGGWDRVPQDFSLDSAGVTKMTKDQLMNALYDLGLFES